MVVVACDRLGLIDETPSVEDHIHECSQVLATTRSRAPSKRRIEAAKPAEDGSTKRRVGAAAERARGEWE